MWSAFWRLHTERPLGPAGSGAIPHSAILGAADRMEMGEMEAEWFVSLIETMDNALLAHRNEKPVDDDGAVKIDLNDVDGIKRMLKERSKKWEKDGGAEPLEGYLAEIVPPT